MTVEVTTGSAGGTGKLIICFAYFPYGEKVPPPELIKLVDFCQKEELPLLKKLLEYLVTTDLEVLNKGNKPTFYAAETSEVLDLTLCSCGSVRKVTDWKVSDEPSLSNHRLITFRLSDLKVEVKEPKEDGLGLLSEGPGNELQGFSQKNLKLKDRRTCNRARNTSRPSDWNLYKKTQKEYRYSVVEAEKSWRDFCESVEGIPATARLCRFLSRNQDATLEVVRMSDGTMASVERYLVYLLEINFPGFQESLDRYWEVDTGFFMCQRLETSSRNCEANQGQMVDWFLPTGRIQVGGGRPCFPGSLSERIGADDRAPQKGAEGLSGP
ncbi:PREDICTED: uncharacterized protein LOC108768350 [Trachymyrmex cornetzi]|uniref:uncharacterized protein LOC108768350 n=1 Tax=Trachymyrmex cornetzi TaxID=471704 RepID=UPI00084EE298|nr:PREDICTED: uncharacterized protein LOC108768350 [Trachymyrmex cornetzi]